MKRLLMMVLSWIPFVYASMWVFRRRPLVVLYHGVTNRASHHGIENYRGKHVPVDVFEKQISWLSKKFNIVSLAHIERAYKEKKCTKYMCAITFDDGYENNFTTALPILKKYHAPATIFVATDFIDTQAYLWPDRLEYMISRTSATRIKVTVCGRTYVYDISTNDKKCVADNDIRQQLKTVDAEKREHILENISQQTGIRLEDVSDTDFAPLSWDHMRHMQKEGITIGAHTRTHPILALQSKDVQYKEIAHSVKRVKDELGDCIHFAYPNGQRTDWNEDTLSIFTELGIGYAWSTFPGRVSYNSMSHALPRITLDQTPYGMYRFKALVSNIIPVIKSLVS